MYSNATYCWKDLDGWWDLGLSYQYWDLCCLDLWYTDCFRPKTISDVTKHEHTLERHKCVKNGNTSVQSIKHRFNRWLKNKHETLTVCSFKWFIPILIKSDGISMITWTDLLGPEDAWGLVCSTKTMRLRSM